MSNSLENLFKKLGVNKDNGLYLKEDKLEINARISYSLNYIDFDAIYVLDDNPLIIFKEYGSISEFDDNIKKFRKNIWNLNDIPIIFIILPDEIQIYNANIFDEESSFLTKFRKDENLDIFNIYNLANGTFFDKYRNSFKNSNKVHDYLLKNIESTINLLKNNLPINIIHCLIGKLIFCKYLNDRGVFDDDYFNEKYGSCFNDIISNKKDLFEFFTVIDESFNLNLFELKEKDKDLILDSHLSYLHQLFSGYDMENNQTVLDCPYDFKIIPIELISNIYEAFLNPKEKRHDKKAIYTPLFLVDYILNRTLDKKLENNYDCRVLDPSCGSGVFLVESFRRIINKNLKRNPNLSASDLKNILTENIYGIDIDEDAINISILSIQLTLLDYLSNDEINNFKMPDLLNKNFFVDDFFNLDGEFNNLDNFDLIVGNPPWGAKQELHEQYYKKMDIPVRNNQIAQSFLVRVGDFIDVHSDVALIIASKILYNKRDYPFRKYFLKHFNLKEVLEFSSIRKEIFNNSVNPASILFYNKNLDGNDEVKHVSFKPNKLFYLLSSVVVQKSDIKFILQDDLINHDWVWKVLVYGNTLDFQLINRLHSKQNIKSCIDKNNLLDSTGIIVGSGGSDATKYFEYDFLDVNKKMLNRYYIDENDVEKWNISYVFRPRREEIFNPPYVLFKSSTNNDYQCVATYSEKQWVYRNNVMSIKGEYNDEKVLKSILAFLNSKLFTYWSFLMFSSVGIEREQILLDEIKTMPVIVNDELVEYVDEILNNVGNDKINIIQKKIDDLIFNLLSFNALERDLIDYFFEVTIPYFKRKNIKYEVNEDDLEEYINIFINYFKPYFKEENNEFFHVECFMSNQFIGINFIIDDKKPNKLIEYNTETDILDFFGNISIEDKNDLFIQKDIKGFEETSFYVIKSNEFKNWHKAVARRDLIEFINSLMGVED